MGDVLDMQHPVAVVRAAPRGAAPRGEQQALVGKLVAELLANPAATQDELAAKFGHERAWIAQVLVSDEFAARMLETGTEGKPASVTAQLEALMLRSIGVLKAKFNRDPTFIPDNLAFRVLEITSRALGMGSSNGLAPGPSVNINIHLEDMADRLTQLLRRRKALTYEEADHGEDKVKARG